VVERFELGEVPDFAAVEAAVAEAASEEARRTLPVATAVVQVVRGSAESAAIEPVAAADPTVDLVEVAANPGVELEVGVELELVAANLHSVALGVELLADLELPYLLQAERS
jgi:hypothetical protein